jgi:hypothetical protein
MTTAQQIRGKAASAAQEVAAHHTRQEPSMQQEHLPEAIHYDAENPLVFTLQT